MSNTRPTPSSGDATRRMRANRRTDTKPEVAVRSILHRIGLRFRKDHPIALSSGKIVRPDIVFTKQKIAIFIDGCFWHSCPQHGTSPKSNKEYWIPKLRENIARDRDSDIALISEGWLVVRIWEHVAPAEAATIISAHVHYR